MGKTRWCLETWRLFTNGTESEYDLFPPLRHQINNELQVCIQDDVAWNLEFIAADLYRKLTLKLFF